MSIAEKAARLAALRRCHVAPVVVERHAFGGVLRLSIGRLHLHVSAGRAWLLSGDAVFAVGRWSAGHVVDVRGLDERPPEPVDDGALHGAALWAAVAELERAIGTARQGARTAPPTPALPWDYSGPAELRRILAEALSCAADTNARRAVREALDAAEVDRLGTPRALAVLWSAAQRATIAARAGSLPERLAALILWQTFRRCSTALRAAEHATQQPTPTMVPVVRPDIAETTAAGAPRVSRAPRVRPTPDNPLGLRHRETWI